MKAIYINKYNGKTILKDTNIPEISNDEVLIKIKASSVNPLDLLIIKGKLKLLQKYSMPLRIGAEFSGIIEKVGENVKNFKVGDKIYTYLPMNNIGAFDEYISINHKYVAKIPNNYDYKVATAIASLTTYQIIKEELVNYKKGDTIFIAGGSGSFGEIAIPILKYFGFEIIVSGNERSKEHILSIGASRYIDYKKEKYWEVLNNVNYVIDTVGAKDFKKQLSILKKGGKIISLINVPNKKFAEKNNFNLGLKILFTMAGYKFDKLAKRENKEYSFFFVKSNGEELANITKIIEDNNINPRINNNKFNLENIDEALQLVDTGHTNGKVVVEI